MVNPKKKKELIAFVHTFQSDAITTCFTFFYEYTTQPILKREYQIVTSTYLLKRERRGKKSMMHIYILVTTTPHNNYLI